MQPLRYTREDLHIRTASGKRTFDSVRPQKFTILIPTEKLAQLSQLANCDN